jgi:hypothetical protein
MQFPIQEKFELTKSFIEQYKDITPKWGFNGLGEFVYMRTYSRLKADGKNEMWYETVQRVVEGLYTIQKQHIKDYNLGWNQSKAQKSAQEMYERIFNFKMLPPGRSLWALGTSIVMERGLTEALYNCSFLSTKNISENPGLPFGNAMDFLMLGVGVGFDVQGAGKIEVKPQKEVVHNYQIPDTREGWVESTIMLINSFFGSNNYEFDYSIIRPAGSPIRTFGGISAGAEPLIELHNGIYNSLTKNMGSPITARTITDMINMVGRAVVSGNVRRSAEIVLGNPDEEFLNLKNYSENPDRAEFGWASNNSIYAELGMDYKEIAERIRDNAEPGVFWKENAQAYSRIRATEKDYKDKRVEGLNPCFSYDSKILTENGYFDIGSLDGQTINVFDADGNIQSAKIFKSGNKDTIKVKLSNKQEIICTPNHILKTFDGEIEAKGSKGLKLLPYLKNKKLEDKYILYGFIQGDGDLGRLKSDKHKGIEVNIGKNDSDILKLFNGHKYTVGERKLYLQDIKDELISLEFSSEQLPNREFPKSYSKWSKFVKSSFLCGCFSANGSTNNRARICYKNTCKNFIEQLKNTLSNDFGIESFITTNKSHNIKFSNGTYKVKESYDLNISKFEDKLKFYNEINFYQKYKIENLKNRILETSPYVSLIKENGSIDVYDFSIDELHWGVINGFIVHNCGEITLEPSELCNLVEMFPNNHDDLEDFKKTIKYAYLYAKTITLLNTNWAETNKVMLRNRRIGLSMTGVVQFISKNGMSTLKKWMREGYSSASYYDEIYSDWFAIPKSKKLTTIKPSGTVSLLAGATPGIHYPESKYYIRRVRLASNSPYVDVLKQSGYNVEPANEDIKGSVVVEFPVSSGAETKTINEVSMWEQLNLASFAQENWADNSVSVTITFKKEEANSIESALDYYQFKLKAVSFLPKLEEGAYAQMPYEEITSEKYEEMLSRITKLDFTDMFSEESLGEKYCSNDGCSI